MPYAYGALPIKSTGDMIGHGAHGLFGALVVESQRAVPPEKSRVELNSSVPPEKSRVELNSSAPTNDPASMSVMLPHNRGKMWEATYTTSLSKCIEGSETNCEAGGNTHTIREFVLFYQDGLNLRDDSTENRWKSSDGTSKLIADCQVCNDSYDLGDQGVNYRSDPFFSRLRGAEEAKHKQFAPEAHFNLNAYKYPENFFLSGYKPHQMPTLRAEVGDEVVIRLIHPGGRARQRTFSLISQDYDDLFPGFGFPHSALLAPGKGVRAALSRRVDKGCFMWHDGTVTLNSGGTWGLLDVVGKDGVSSCDK